MKADKGYIYRGISGWSIAFFYRTTNSTKFFHGFADWDVAFTALQMYWREATNHQNGFPSEVSL